MRACGFPGCDEGMCQERNCGLCRRHADEWLRSPEFRAAVADEEVRFAVNVLGKAAGKRALAKHRRRWLKAKSEEMDS